VSGLARKLAIVGSPEHSRFMGKLGREIAGTTVEVRDELLRAYADEWFAHYNYFFVSHAVHGPSSPPIAALLRRKSQEAFVRADRLAQRMIELGEQPVPKLTDLGDAASDKPFKLPDGLSDMEGLLKAVLDADRTSLRTFQHLLDLTRNRDVLTETLVVDMLRQAVAGEQELERLLSEEAPEMTGR
jgi:bacterioferritin